MTQQKVEREARTLIQFYASGALTVSNQRMDRAAASEHLKAQRIWRALGAKIAQRLHA